MKAAADPTPISAAPTERSGFSLLEVLMAIVLLGVLGLLLALLGQGSLHISQLQDESETRQHQRQNTLSQHFAGESDEPALRLLPTPRP